MTRLSQVSFKHSSSRRSSRFALFLFVLACGGGVVMAESPVNKMCPVMPLEEADPAITTVYKGMQIAFCCERCLHKFEANPERYAASLAAYQDNASQKESDSQTGGDALGDQEHAVNVSDEHASTGDADEHARREADADHESHRDEADEEIEQNHTNGAVDLPKIIDWLGRFHPPMVNFPIAMMIGAAVAEFLRMITKRKSFVGAGRFCLWLGGLGALVAGVLGWFFGGFHLSDGDWVMTTHRWLGTATVLWALMTLVVGERAYRASPEGPNVAYRLMLLVGALAVLASGFFGGSLVYGIDHYAW